MAEPAHPLETTDAGRPPVHAIIVAGGAGSRLAASAPEGTPPKPLLTDHAGHRLIDGVLDACADCQTRIVVGPEMELPTGVVRVREDPPLSGPAAAIGAGVEALADTGAGEDDLVLLLAADLAAPHQGVAVLREHAAGNRDTVGATGTFGTAGVVGTAGTRMQPLFSLIRFGPLRRAADTDLRDTSVMRLLRRTGLGNLDTVELPASTAADVDTWQDALAHGFGDRDGR
jgi:molybdopterin-guanine dinucleotide biosynthesis protein A